MKNFQLKKRILVLYFCLVLLVAVFSHAAGAGEWDMEKVVETALQNSEIMIRAGEELRQKELDLQSVRALSGSTFTVSADRTRMRSEERRVGKEGKTMRSAEPGKEKRNDDDKQQ